MTRPGFLGKGGRVQALKSFSSTFRSNPLSFDSVPSAFQANQQSNDFGSCYG